MIFNPGLFQAPDFFRFYGDDVEENESACLAPIGPGQLTNLHNLIQFSYFTLSLSILHHLYPIDAKKRRGFTLSFSILNILPQCQEHSQRTSQL
jgi:hypothetical protein